MRPLLLLLPALLLLSACSSVESVTMSEAVGQAESTTIVEQSTTTNVPSTTSTSALAEDVKPVDRAGRVDHLLEPWLPENDELPSTAEILMERSDWNDGSFDECPETVAFGILSESALFALEVETSESFDGHMVGLTEPGTSLRASITQLANAGPCLRDVLGAEEDLPVGLESSAGPDVEGIEASSIITFIEEGVRSHLVFATTGDRVVHVLTARRTEWTSDSEIEQRLRSIVQKAPEAQARVEECVALYTERLDRIDDQRCDGFEHWNPDLELRAYGESSLLDLLDDDGTTTVSYYGWYPSSELMLQPKDVAAGAGGRLGETNVPADLTACEDELGALAGDAAKFDQWLEVESEINDPATGVDVFQTVGVAPNAAEAVAAIRAYAEFDRCLSFAAMFGSSTFSSERLVDLPPRVLEGMAWTIKGDESTTIVADFAFDNGVVTSIAHTSSSTDLWQVMELLDIVVSRLPAYDARTTE